MDKEHGIISAKEFITSINRINEGFNMNYTTHDYIFKMALFLKIEEETRNESILEIDPNFLYYEYSIDSLENRITMHNKVDKGFYVIRSIFFAGHFIHFDSGVNFLGQKNRNTALTNCIKSTKKTIEYKEKLGINLDSIDKTIWNTNLNKKTKCNLKRFMKSLANSCHFLADMNAPHHISNSIGPKVFNVKRVPLMKNANLSNHKKFERFTRAILNGTKDVEIISKGEYSLNDFDLEGCYKRYIDLRKSEKQKYEIDEYCRLLADESIKNTKSYVDLALSLDANDNIKAMFECIKMSVVQVARLIDYIIKQD